MHTFFSRSMLLLAVSILCACDNKAESQAHAAIVAGAPLMVAGQAVTASCFSLLLSDEEHPPGEGVAIAAAQCHRDDIKPADASNPTDYAYAYLANTLSPAGMQEGGRRGNDAVTDGRMTYTVVGQINGDAVVHYTETTNDEAGTVFDSLLRVEVRQKQIRLHSVYSGGGDRCSGGIVQATVDGGHVFYSTSLTATGLLALAGTGDDISEQSSDNVLPPCVATVQNRDKDIQHVVLNKTAIAAQTFSANAARNACVKTALQNLAQQQGEGVSLSTLKEWYGKINMQCGKS